MQQRYILFISSYVIRIFCITPERVSSILKSSHNIVYQKKKKSSHNIKESKKNSLLIF